METQTRRMKNSFIALASAVCLATSLSLLSGCNDTSTDSNRTPDNMNTNRTRSETPRSNPTTVDADNSGKNMRDRNDATLTPGDQGNTPSDRELTQKIRKALVSDTSYSTSAKNVKIITTGGRVTLRGPVKSPEEKTGVAAIAKSVAGDANVDDQLEIKANL
jgi:hyperosmotically inducible protein